MRKHMFKQALSLVLVFSVAICPITVFATDAIIVGEEIVDGGEAEDKQVEQDEVDTNVIEDVEVNTNEDVEKTNKKDEKERPIQNKQEVNAPQYQTTGASPMIMFTPTISVPNQTYTGKEIEPEVTVSLDDNQLELDKDYKVVYKDNIEVGVATVEVTLTMDETKKHKKEFIISPRNISEVKISAIKNVSYTGRNITPTLNVAYGDVNLVNNDYLVTYQNNKRPGKATVTITGRGNFTGTKTADFHVLPSTPSDFKMKKSTQSAITLSWKRVNNATGYIIYRYNEKTKTYKKIKTITNNKTTTFTQKKLDSFTTYRYKILSYVKVSGKLYKGSQSKPIKGRTKIEKANIRSAVASNTSVKISWDKVSGASSYIIYMSTSKKGKYKKINTTGAKNTSYTEESLSPGTTYFFKIRTCIKVNKSKQYGAYSKVRNVQTRTDIRLEGLEGQIVSNIQTKKTNQYNKSTNQVMTKAHYLALEALCESYSGDQISDSDLLKEAKKLKYKKYKGTKKVALKSSNAMKLQFPGVHMDSIMATVNSQIKGKKDFIYVRVYYNAGANQTTVYLINGGIL